MGEFRPSFPQLKDDKDGRFGTVLKEVGPLFIFVCPPVVNNGDSSIAALVEKLAAEYNGRVKFFWVDSSEDKNFCQRLFLNGVPTVILFHQSKEVARFSCSSSEPGIYYHLGELLSPNPYSGLEYIKGTVPAA